MKKKMIIIIRKNFKNPCFIGSTGSGDGYDYGYGNGNGYTFKDPALNFKRFSKSFSLTHK